MADRVGIINNGGLVAIGTVEELKRQASETGTLENVFLALVGVSERAAPAS
jgi:ABC-2 type transport system ATP-binding protein